MKITRNNYEAYFLDYLEGNLDKELVDDFLDFLKENPDLEQELQLVGSVKLEADTIAFERKESLYKEKYDLPEYFEETAIAFIEGELSETMKNEFEAYLLAHPLKRDELELFKRTKLQPDNHIVFRKKNRLYRLGKEKRILLWFTRVAAVIAIAFLVYRMANYIGIQTPATENHVIISEHREEVPESTNLQEHAVRKEYPALESEKIPVAESRTEIKVPSEKYYTESNKEPLDYENIAEKRVSLEVPEKIPPLYASLQTDADLHTTLLPMELRTVELPDPVDEERLLGDIVREKTGLDNLSVKNVARAGLGLISSISGEKFNYQMNNDGQITELNYDSRLLAFTIPTKQVR